jgi:hypothetical protein
MSFRSMVHRSTVAAVGVLAAAMLTIPSAYASGSLAVPGGKALPSTTESKLLTVKYTRNWTWVSHDLKVCVKFTASGRFTYRVKETFTTHAAQDHWIDQTIHDPTLKVVVFNVRCKVHRSVMSVSIGQHWTGFGCSFNPHISISVSVTGLSIALSGWPTCGNRTQAIYSTSYGRGYHHTQFNSGSPIGFGQYTDPLTGVGLLFPPPCYGVFPSAVVHAAGNSDSFGAGKVKHAAKVCLNKTS